MASLGFFGWFGLAGQIGSKVVFWLEMAFEGVCQLLQREGFVVRTPGSNMSSSCIYRRFILVFVYIVVKIITY